MSRFHRLLLRRLVKDSTTEPTMNSQKLSFDLSICVVLAIAFGGLMQTCYGCSYNPNRPWRSLTGLTILAPVVIVGKAINISVFPHEQSQTRYSACFAVQQVIKGDRSNIPSTLCTKYFGGESLCLAHVSPGYPFLLYLNSDLSARYDADFSAAYTANRATISLARKGYCNNVEVNDSSCVEPSIKDKLKRTYAVKEGKNLSLECNAFGTKPFIVTWYFMGKKENIPLKTRVTRDGSLYFSAVSQSHQGRYTCVVRNPAGETSQRLRLFVEKRSCGDMIMVKKRSDIVSPNYPGQYPHDKSCAWRLCPPTGKRLKFIFNIFHLDPLDSIVIENECTKSLEIWRKYCGTNSPGQFVSHCATGCVQLRLLSILKSAGRLPALYIGMNVTVEPTSEERTPKLDVKKHYCASDIVLKGMFINWQSWKEVKIKATETFKKPNKANTVYTMVYRGRDSYGCYRGIDSMRNGYVFGVKENGEFKIKHFVSIDRRNTGLAIETELRKYKDMVSPCELPV